MPIVKLASGSFQAKILSPDCKSSLTKAFPTYLEAARQLAQWKVEKRQGKLRAKAKLPMLDEYFIEWFSDMSEAIPKENQSGWTKTQLQQYRDYVRPTLGTMRLNAIKPQLVKRALNEVAKKGRGPQTQRHVFVLLRQLFGDAIEVYQYLTFNPVLRSFNPDVPTKEARRLNLEQVRRLLIHVPDKKYGLAVWIQLYIGLRCGELQALRWEDVDLADGRIVIRRTFVKKTGRFRNYPKGRKQHSHSIPIELCEFLQSAKKSATDELVVHSPRGAGLVLPQRWYLRALRRYCLELGIPVVGTHGLRHSTSEIYMSHGASRDDLRILFGHSSQTVTDRYIRDRASNLEKVSNVIRLFPSGSKTYTKNVHAASDGVVVDCK